MKHTATPFTLVLAVSLSLILPGLSQAQRFNSNRNNDKLNQAFREVVSGPSDCVVRIYCDDREAALGTIVDAEGWIVTKASLLKGKVICQFKDGRRFNARIIGVESNNDLAMLRVERTGLKAIAWRPAKTAEPGEWLATVAPQEQPAAIGVVSVGVRKPNRSEQGPSAPPPNSGFLGIQLRPDTDGRPIIEVITPKSAAEKAGLQVGDIVLSVAGRKVESTDRLIATIQSYKAGESIGLRVKRGEEVKSIRATLEKRPNNMASRGDRMNAMGSELSVKRTGFPTILQHDTVVKPSECGSPVVDLDGKALGINIARAGRTESYAIPSETVIALLSELKSGKLAPAQETDAMEIDEAEVKEMEAELTKTQQKVASLSKDLERALEEADVVAVTKLRKELDTCRAKVEELRSSLDNLRKDKTKP